MSIQKTLGLIGGMSWESTAIYYEAMNREISERLGGLHSAQLVMVSVDFDELAIMQRESRWGEIGDELSRAAVTLERAGAEAIVVCTNTMHLVASQVEAAVDVPLLHIVDATGRALSGAGRRKVGLLGTQFTMSGDMYSKRLLDDFGIDVIVPDPSEWEEINRIIFDELCRGRIESSSRDTYVAAIERLASAGAEAVILGCTEIGLLIDDETSPLPVLDTARVHASAAVDFALS